MREGRDERMQRQRERQIWRKREKVRGRQRHRDGEIRRKLGRDRGGERGRD